MAAVILSIVAIGISAVAAYYTYQTVKVTKEMKEEQERLTEESRRDRRVDNIVHNYLEMHYAHKDSGLSVFLKSDLGDLSDEEIEIAAKRVLSATGEDPLKSIREILKEHDIGVRRFIAHVIMKHYSPHMWNLSGIISEIKSEK